MAQITGLVERVIPNRSNRTLWWLIVLSLIAFFVGAPIATALVLPRVFDRPLGNSVVVLLITNAVALVIIGVGMALVLRRPHAVTVRQALTSTALVVVIGTLVRVIGLSAYGPVNWLRFAAFITALSIIYYGIVVAAVLYGSTLERALDDSYAANARTQAALLREEESVRSQVFDQLHGTLQAEFVAMRRMADDLADRTSDPAAAASARELDVRLEEVYRRGVETIARAIAPAGIDAGLLPAVHDLQARVGDAMQVEVVVDPIVMVLDDPMTGGIRREVRLAAYRVIEECVSNASRHARADHVHVHLSSALRSGAAWLLIEVRNPVAHAAAFVEGQGLTRMRSRVDALDGVLRIPSTTAEFTVIAEFPLQGPNLS